MLNKALICLKKVLRYNLLIITKNYKLLLSFANYADFESNLKEVEKPNRDYADVSYTGK